jgi:hypothetical protein
MPLAAPADGPARWLKRHPESLFPMGEVLLEQGRFNIAFFARGGCSVQSFAPPRWRSGSA